MTDAQFSESVNLSLHRVDERCLCTFPSRNPTVFRVVVVSQMKTVLLPQQFEVGRSVVPAANAAQRIDPDENVASPSSQFLGVEQHPRFSVSGPSVVLPSIRW